MNLYKKLFMASVFCAASLSANAGNFDGSKPLLCAMMETSECLPSLGCGAVTPESINLPSFLDIDFKKKMISSPDPITSSKDGKNKKRSAKIKRIEKIEGLTVLQGAQNGRGWTMSISQANGKMTISAAGDQVAFVVQGACTPR